MLSNKQGKSVKLVRVPGKKSPRTKTVDKLAKRSAQQASKRQLNPSEVRRKRTSQPIEIGSVEMDGQTMTIHIFKSEYQPLHRRVRVNDDTGNPRIVEDFGEVDGRT